MGRFLGMCVSAWILLACQRGVPSARDGGAVPFVVKSSAADAGWVLTLDKLDGWLRWERAVMALAPIGRSDGGALGDEVRRRARVERALMTEEGLTSHEVDQIEAVISSVVVERNVERMTGVAALEQLKASLGDLPAEQQAKVEAAFGTADAGTAAPASLALLESKFGPQAVKIILEREAEVTHAWESLTGEAAFEQ